MSIASAITAAQGKVANAYTAVSTKGGTLPATQNLSNLPTAISSIPSGGGGVITSLSVTPTTSAQTITASGGVDGYSPISVSAVTSSIDNNIVAGNIKKDVTILGVTGTYEGSGGGGGSGKYKIGDRVYDSGNNDIGTVFGFYTDANDVEYAVVCLNAEHRSTKGKWADSSGLITNMPLYSSVNTAAWGIGTETATANCDLILASKTSTAVSHCRSKSFLIDGTTYYGQLPNICELLQMFAMHYKINADDPTASSAGTTLNFTSWKTTWSSSQRDSSVGWGIGTTGNPASYTTFTNYFVAPVLEIPNRSNS